MLWNILLLDFRGETTACFYPGLQCRSMVWCGGGGGGVVPRPGLAGVTVVVVAVLDQAGLCWWSAVLPLCSVQAAGGTRVCSAHHLH